MSAPDFTIKQNATLTLELDALDGDVGTVTAVQATLRRLKSPSYVLSGADPVAANFTITPRAAAGPWPAGWTLKLPPSVTLPLESGLYAADARLSFGADDAEVTKSWTIFVEVAASRP